MDGMIKMVQASEKCPKCGVLGKRHSVRKKKVIGLRLILDEKRNLRNSCDWIKYGIYRCKNEECATKYFKHPEVNKFTFGQSKYGRALVESVLNLIVIWRGFDKEDNTKPKSLRSFAKIWEIPETTLHDWVRDHGDKYDFVKQK